MSKTLLFLWMLTVCFSCSPDSPNEEPPEVEKTFNVNLTPSVSVVSVDLPFEIKVQSNEPLYDITQVFENSTQSIVAAMPGTALDNQFLNLNIQFGYIGPQEVEFEFTSIRGKKIRKTLNFDIIRGNAVKITGFKINSFYNINGTWDAEYADDDPNRLADIVFAFRKLFIPHFSKPEQKIRQWYLSPIYPNQQQLEWDLSQEDLYISDRSIIDFKIGDDDGNGIGQDLARDFQGLNIRLNDYRDTKPAEINLRNEEYGFDISFQLEWL